MEAGAERGRGGHLLAASLLVEASQLTGPLLAGGKRCRAVGASARTPLLHPQPPDLAAAMDRIAAVDPVGEEEGAVGGDRQIDRPELLIPLDGNPRGRPARSPIGPRLKHLEPVVPPTTHPQAPVEGDDVARGFAGAGGHRERARQFAVPGLKRMPPAAAIAKLIAIVAGGNDFDQPAGGPAVGVVVNGEQAAVGIESKSKWIPKPGGDPFEMVSFGRGAKNGSPLPFPRPARSVGSREFVGDAEVLSQADDEAAIGIEGHAAEAVVGIVAGGIEREEIFTGVGDVVAIGVTDPEDGRPGGDVDPALGPGRSAPQPHRRLRPLVKRPKTIGPAVAVGVLDEADPVVGRTDVALGAMVGVRLDDEEPPFFIMRAAGRRDDVGRGRE